MRTERVREAERSQTVQTTQYRTVLSGEPFVWSLFTPIQAF